MQARSRAASEAPFGLFSSTIALYAAALGIALLIYLPSLRGPFLSDDSIYLTQNPQVQAVTVENLLEILDPTGDLSLRVANYAPLHLLGHMAEWTLFGECMPAYHLVNVALHALVVVLLIGLLNLLSGFGLGLAPGSGAWWLTRPLWLLALAACLGLFIPIFARFEQRSRARSAGSLPAWRSLGGAVGVCAGVALLALGGIGGEGPLGLRVGVLLLTFAGVALVLGLPSFSNSRAAG